MNTALMPSAAAALPGADRQGADAGLQDRYPDHANQAWEIDRTLMLERSEHRAWMVAAAGAAVGLIGIAAVFAQGPLRRVVEVPIVVDRTTGETLPVTDGAFSIRISFVSHGSPNPIGCTCVPRSSTTNPECL